jgi:hypothetical protein
MSDDRGITGRFRVRTVDDVRWIYSRGYPVDLKIDDATCVITFRAGHHEAFLPVDKRRFFEAQALARRIATSWSGRIMPTEQDVELLISFGDPRF